MQVLLSHIEEFFKSSDVRELQFDLSDLKFANTYKITTGSINFRKHIDLEYLQELKEKKIDQVSVCISKENLNIFRKLFPKDYPYYQFEEPVTSIKKREEFIEKMNQHSNKKRQLVLQQEIIKLQGVKQSILFKCGTPLNENILTKISLVTESDYKIQYSYNEEGVLVFVNDTAKNIMLRIDILALLAQSDYPIIYAETLDEAITIAQTRNPKIIVTTNLEKSWESKGLFLEAYKYDPFQNFINYDESPTKNRGEELIRIKTMYQDDYEARLERFKLAKSIKRPILDGKIRNPLMDKIEFVRNNFSLKNYYEIRYYVHKLSQKCNVTTIENILKKMHG